MATLLRLAGNPVTRQYAPLAPLLHTLVGPFLQHSGVSGSGGSSVTAAHRARWAACRHLLVVVARSWVVRAGLRSGGGG